VRAPITQKQRTNLLRVESVGVMLVGPGAMWDGISLDMAHRLVEKGLLTGIYELRMSGSGGRPSVWRVLRRVKLSDAGRAALAAPVGVPEGGAA
jgi:hypothetical protein